MTIHTWFLMFFVQNTQFDNAKVGCEIRCGGLLKTKERWLRSSLRISLSTSSVFFAPVGKLFVFSRLVASSLGISVFNKFGTPSTSPVASSLKNHRVRCVTSLGALPMLASPFAAAVALYRTQIHIVVQKTSIAQHLFVCDDLLFSSG